MIKRNPKNILIWIIIWVFLIWYSFNAYAAWNDIEGYTIIPELTPEETSAVATATEEIWSTAWEVMKTHREEAKKLTTSQKIASWIMDWDAIIEYLSMIVKFLSQAWLVVWVVFIMYAWYKYMVSVFNWWQVPSKVLKNAIIWVIIVIFSYAILRTLTSLVWI